MTDPTATGTATGGDDLHEEAMQRFRDAVLPQLPVRESALEARQFCTIPGAQWAGSYGDLFGDAVKMQVDKIGRSLRKLENDYRENRIEPDYRPAGGASDQETANTLDGLHRADSYRFNAQAARDNAFSEAARGGMGAYRLTAEWADPLDKHNDEQVVNPAAMIVDADQCVFFDPDATSYAKEKAQFAFVVVSMSQGAFEAEYPDASAVDWPQEVTRRDYPWFGGDTIAVAEYYRIEEKTESVSIFTLAATGEEQREWTKDVNDRDELIAKGWTERTRKAKRRRCWKSVHSGAETLVEAVEIAGGNIPIVLVYANRHYVDGVEWFWGIQPKMDAQRGLNAAISRVARIDATSGFEKPVFAPAQIPPALQDLWARNHIDDLPYLLAEPLLNPDGTFAQLGETSRVKPASVPETTAALIQIHNANLTEDDQDGAGEVRANVSEEAMNVAAARVDAKSGINLDNMRQSVQREGVLYLGMVAEVYVEPGRVVETMTIDGDDGEATLAEDYLDGETLKVRNNFAEGRYKVIAGVTEATATRRDRTVKAMLNMASVYVTAQDMEGAQAALITAAANSDGEGLDDFIRWNRKRGLSLGLFEPNEDEQREMAEQAQAQQQPDAAAVVAEAQADALKAGAEKDRAQAAKVGSEIALNVAKAANERVEAGLRPVEAANDAMPAAASPQQRIAFGRDLT